MKKILLLALSVLWMVGLNAQVSLTRAKKYAIFEHFTQASCGPCAAQNPAFQDNILTQNKGALHHIAHHTSWPGYDPMHDYNPEDVQARVDYYGVNGVPDMVMLGNQYQGSPAGVSQDMLDNAVAGGSPLRVLVGETTAGTTRTVTITVDELDAIPDGDYRLRVAVVEGNIEFSSPPGSNGEVFFPNVLRKIITGPDGVEFTPKGAGNTQTFSYDYELDESTWVTDQIYAIAFLQNDDDKTIVNSGSSRDPHWEFLLAGNNYAEGKYNEKISFSAVALNNADIMEKYKFSLSTVSAPSGWADASFDIKGTTVTNSTEIDLPGGTPTSLTLNVVPGILPGVATYKLTMEATNGTDFAPVSLVFTVISGCYELLVNNSKGVGDGSGKTAFDWAGSYISGLDAAGAYAYGSISEQTFIGLSRNNALGKVKRVYYNIGWTFPGLPVDLVAEFTKFLDNGGRLLIAGQDVCWEAFDEANSPYQTQEARDFFNNYLGVDFVSDGSQTSKSITAKSADAVFGTTPKTDLFSYYGSGSNGPYYYPEEVATAGTGTAIFNYNTGSVVAGIRNENASSNFKTVYLGVGLEMLKDSKVADAIMATARTWFTDEVDGVAFDAAMQQAILGQNYPNPCQSTTQIAVNNAPAGSYIEVLSVDGKLLMAQSINSTVVTINTENLNAGQYLYRIITPGQIAGQVRSMEVVK